jgi:hypothetical protein
MISRIKRVLWGAVLSVFMLPVISMAPASADEAPAAPAVATSADVSNVAPYNWAWD